MESSFSQIEAQALNLPPEERARLAESLLESVQEPGDAETEAAWEHEIQERLAAYRRGEEEAVDWDTLLTELRGIAR